VAERDRHHRLAAGPVPATYGIPGLPHPDGLGIWAEHGREATFLLEYDTGSEHLPQLTAKLTGYGNVAKAMADLDNICPLLLFCFRTPRREQAARRALAACYHAPALRIATTAIDPQQASPTGPVWLPLRRAADSGGQVALCALDAALPDPWRDYRTGQERARQQATQPREPPARDEGDGTWRDE